MTQQNPFDKKIVDDITGGAPKARITGVLRDRTPPEPKDEENNVDIKRTIKVHINSESYTIMEDGSVDSPNGNDLNIVNKKTGIGVIFRSNGDILFMSGGKVNGQACGGRILVNARGGQLIKTGPSIAEFTSDGKGPQEKGSTELQDIGQLAKSELHWGKVVNETHGDYRIRARSITLDAQDVLTLIGKEKIVLQAGPNGGGKIVMKAGSVETETNISDRWVKSQDMTVASERTTMQYDPRGTDNLISAGHRNIKTFGDLSVQSGGVARLKVLGLGSVPLVKDSRLSALNVHCVRGNLSMMTNIGSIMSSAGGGGSWPSINGVGSYTVKAKTNIKQEALINYEAKATGKMDLEAVGAATLKATGAVTVEGVASATVKSAGIVTVRGTFIKLN
tara:strand:+ start:2670 stop:3845 length:1176 start_codon:yes stop_codon:yes gene_type:complete